MISAVGVLVTCSGGAAGHTVLSLLRRACPDSTLTALESKKYAAAELIANRFIGGAPRVDEPEYMDFILTAAVENRASVVLPCHSSELIPFSKHRQKFKDKGIAIPGPRPDQAAIAADKLRLYDLLRQEGLNVPEYSQRAQELTSVPVGDHLIVKPRLGAGGRGQVILRTREDAKARTFREDLIAQRLVDGQEYSIDGVILSDGRIMGPITRRRLSTQYGLATVGEGRVACNTEATVFSQVVQALQPLNGPVNVQVIRDSLDCLWIIDVNLRFPAGGMALTAALGLNMPYEVVRDLSLGPSGLGMPSLSKQTMRHYRYWTDTCYTLREPGE